jgi:hypothetical protein
VIEQVAAEHEREIEDDHFVVLIPYAMDAVPDTLVAQLAKRCPDLDDPTTLVPVGRDAAVDTVKWFVDVGTTKFVLIPIVEPAVPSAMSFRPPFGDGEWIAEPQTMQRRFSRSVDISRSHVQPWWLAGC